MKLRNKYAVRLPKMFSEVIIHDGVPELGVIEDYDNHCVDWEFTDRELYAVLSDAHKIANIKRFVTIQNRRTISKEIFVHQTSLRRAATAAAVQLQAVIDENALEQPPYM